MSLARVISWQVTTWNVLHRVHAVNWGEAAIDEHPEEPARIAAITSAVAGQIEGGARVVCLQEVSGDQLRSLRERLPLGAALFHHCYPRLPRLHHGGAPVLDDPSEHLVTVVAGAGAQVARAETFASDAGKGFLGVDLGDGCVAWNAHVTWGAPGADQMRALTLAARACSGTAIMMGDFNAAAAAVRAALGADLRYAELADQRPTRVADGGKPGTFIDHVVALRGRLEDARVLDGAGLSDHHPVTARVVREA
jgi:hypothetical protein